MCQVLSLFLALLLSSFSTENMKANQQHDQDGVDSNNNDEEQDEDEDEAKNSDNQLAAAFERLGRWVKFLTVRLSSLRRRWETNATGRRAQSGAAGARLTVTSTTDTACSADAALMHLHQPALLANFNDTEVLHPRQCRSFPPDSAGHNYSNASP